MELINFSRLARETKILTIILFGFIVRLLLAIYNSFVSILFVAKDDALRFHENAVAKSQSFNLIFTNMSDGWIYSSFIAFFYYFLTPSIFIPSLLNCFIWFGSALILNKIFKILKLNEINKKIGFILYSFAPTSIVYTSVSLRESLQLFFLNLIVYFILKFFLSNKNIYFFYIVFVNICLSSLHKVYNVLFVFVVILFIIQLINYSEKIRNFVKKNIYFYYIFAFIILITIILFHINELAYFIKIIFDRFEDFLRNMPDSRTNYMLIYKIENYFHFILDSLIFYNFKPFPSDVDNVSDLIYFFENVLRFILIIYCLYNFVYFQNSKAHVIIFFILCTLEILWSLGTTNWGSASRHHVVTYGILILFVIRNNFLTRNMY